MNRQEFEELELQLQQSGLPLKSFLQQLGVSYSTYHYWRKKCSVDKNSVKQELAPISFKQAATESSLEEQVPHGVALLFPGWSPCPLRERFRRDTDGSVDPKSSRRSCLT